MRLKCKWAALTCFRVLLFVGPLGHLMTTEGTERGAQAFYSPSKHWVLRVQASESSGSAAAQYTMEHMGKQAWQTTFPYCLDTAQVTNDGVIAGWAYSAGRSGLQGGADAARGWMYLVVVDHGKVLWSEQTARYGSGFFDRDPLPTCRMACSDSVSKRFIFVVQGQDYKLWGDEWIAVSLAGDTMRSSTKPGRGLTDQAGMVLGPHQVLALGDSSLFATTWTLREGKPAVAVLDAAGILLWKFCYPSAFDGSLYLREVGDNAFEAYAGGFRLNRFCVASINDKWVVSAD